MTITFEPWPKIPRLNRDIVVTEKIDGTNAAIVIEEIPNFILHTLLEMNEEMSEKTIRQMGGFAVVEGDDDRRYLVGAQSRNKLIFPGKQTDNAGFAGWVDSWAGFLVGALGEGRHFGEWWGSGIQRRYDEVGKRFSLFNVDRYADLAEEPLLLGGEDGPASHSALDVVPVLYRGPFSQDMIEGALESLRNGGSVASPGFMRPEGVVVYHTAARQTFKVLLEGDERPKGITPFDPTNIQRSGQEIPL